MRLRRKHCLLARTQIVRHRQNVALAVREGDRTVPALTRQSWPHNAINAYLSELLLVYTPSRTLRSSSDTRMLEIQQYKRKTHGFCTFSCFGPHIWNSLPQDRRHCSTLWVCGWGRVNGSSPQSDPLRRPRRP